MVGATGAELTTFSVKLVPIEPPRPSLALTVTV
jgi:hypothetical protein